MPRAPLSWLAVSGVLVSLFALREQAIAIGGRRSTSRPAWPPSTATEEIAARPHARARWGAILSRVSARPWLLLSLIAAVAAASRVRYVIGFSGTYGSGDAHLLLTHALFIREWRLHPPAQLAITGDIFGQPPLIPAALALVSRATMLPLELTPLVVMPLLTIAAIVILTRLLARQFGWPVALAAGTLISLLPRLAFDSTEPEKAPVVVSLFVFALACVYAGVERPRFLLLAGFFIGLAMLAHTTGYLFLPVIVLSYLGLHAGAPRRAVNRYAVASLAFPALAVATYFALARSFDFASAFAPGPAVGGSSGGVLPSFVQTYVDALINLGHGGITHRAWRMYEEGIRAQLGTPLFLLAVAGFLAGSYQVIARREWHIAPFLLWALLVTVGFGMQYPASSHGSRYPSYVTPAYVVLAAYAGAFACAHARRFGAIAAGAMLLVLLEVGGYVGWTYAAAPNPGLRDLYASHAKAAQYIDDQHLLDNGGLLYLEWPSVTFNILEDQPQYEDRLYGFGFGQRDLAEFTPQFIAAHHIKYFLFDHTGNDGYDSANMVRQSLTESMLIREVATFTGRPGSYVTLFELAPRSTWTTTDVHDLLSSARSGRVNSVIGSDSLCLESSGGTSVWEPNGWVHLTPVGRGSRLRDRHRQCQGVRRHSHDDPKRRPYRPAPDPRRRADRQRTLARPHSAHRAAGWHEQARPRRRQPPVDDAIRHPRGVRPRDGHPGSPRHIDRSGRRRQHDCAGRHHAAWSPA